MRQSESGVWIDPYRKRFRRRDFDGRWRGNEAPRGLTWGTLLEGRSFFEAAGKFVDLENVRNILEIGPGYGRLLDGMAELGISPGCYVGVDLSAERIEALGARHGSDSRRFVSGDVRSIDLSGLPAFDLVISSATFEHLAPDFVTALVHLRGFLSDEAAVAFDLIDTGDNEGKTGIADDGTFVRYYSLDEMCRYVEAADYRFQGLTRFAMSSVDIAIKPSRLVRDDTYSRQDGEVALVHRFLVAARAGPRRKTLAASDQAGAKADETLLRRLFWRPLPLAAKIVLKRLIVDTLGIPVGRRGR
jgi:SAM-dependent methyltransferase